MNKQTKPRMPERLNVGVSIFIRKGEQSLWENGIFQNCLYLVMLLKRSPRVKATYLVTGGGDGGPEDAKRFLVDSPAPLIDMETAMTKLDVMIEMSAQLNKEWSIKFRDGGGKIITMRVGNDYVIDIERMVFNLQHALLISGAPYDEVWTLPEYERSCAPYFETLFRAPVKLMPHLWSPVVLDREVAKLPEGQTFGYQRGRGRWRIGIFEPNVCMVKTSYIPMLCCEMAHRENPDMIERMYAYNTFKLKDHPGFAGFAQSLNIVKHGLGFFEGRYPFAQIVPVSVDAVVSHQWENPQNYVYYEALYGGYPLIHNSHLIGDCGYRYQDFDCEEGGRALRRAFAVHDENLASYQASAKTFLKTLDPENEENVRLYTQAIEAVYART
ncbi:MULTISPECIES: DUF2827 domain-containing protein [unclassified Caballeronia]|uniref:DUF2827 domain-containing protein n=1 Tax=unclassified Caballeronia TaxID=2646786 RepID=UPI001FD06791|nr:MULTISPECIES: DUF2827 domain-containing protein [unclassified Caballeronia]MDR5772498.1 DUF2827 domain-containing protein [Caballeronia sp. LZ002]MDR5804073.1 DUF2827 domain-containing protein [Caballeronia sp. LZ001]MDR5847932.1 DUF2827 domain-containing protein [Caballeronia sp. LZ003]